MSRDFLIILGVCTLGFLLISYIQYEEERINDIEKEVKRSQEAADLFWRRHDSLSLEIDRLQQFVDSLKVK
jgi:hypothetical protein